MEKKWFEDIENWDKVPFETYKFMVTRAEKRFNDILLDSEVMTDRSIKLLSAVVLSISYFAFIKTGTLSTCTLFLFILIILLYIIDIGVLIKLQIPRNMVSKGASPKEMFLPRIEKARDGQ